MDMEKLMEKLKLQYWRQPSDLCYCDIMENCCPDRCDMAEQDERLVGITPAMCEGSGMVEFSKRFPEGRQG